MGCSTHRTGQAPQAPYPQGGGDVGAYTADCRRLTPGAGHPQLGDSTRCVPRRTALVFAGTAAAPPAMRARWVIFPVTLVALLGAGCGGGGRGAESSNAEGKPAAPPGRLTAGRFAGTAASPSQAAPPLRLRNALGREVDIDQYRGKAVLV